jgi:hypothetical protein
MVISAKLPKEVYIFAGMEMLQQTKICTMIMNTLF